MRITLSLAVFTLLAGASIAQSSYSHEAQTYRYGGTYNTIASNSVENCAAICSQDQSCRAWSFQRETKALGPARCELKSVIGRATTNPLMVSGINPYIANQGQVTERRTPSVDTLLGAPNTGQARNVIVNHTASSVPAPLRSRAPTSVRVPTPPVPQTSLAPRTPTFPPTSSPTPPPPSNINAPEVAPNTLPPGAVLRDAPPPQISFEPLAPSPARPATRPLPPPPRVPQPETVTVPNNTGQLRTPARLQLNTVPAGSVQRPPSDPSRPYNDLSNKEFPNYSVNNRTVLTPEEFAEQETLERETIENVEIDEVDLATDIGEPVFEGRIRERQRSGGS